MSAAETDGLTVGEVAARLGITVRTLHHWDDVSLVVPSGRSSKGYRLYGTRDLALLQRVVIYRELGLSLARIRRILAGEASEPVAALQEQRRLVHERIARLEGVSEGLERMIRSHEHGVLLSPEEQVAIFGAEWQPDWTAQARERWGDSPQWAEYAERASSRTPDDWRQIAERTAELEARLAQALDAGVNPESEEADALVEEHRAAFSAYFQLTREMQVGLGRMYEADPAFSEHYERVRPGLASWLRLAIDAGARRHGIDPDTAVWG